MSNGIENTTANANEATEHKPEVVEDNTVSTLVDTLFDIGLAWAEFGVGQGKRALENSAKTLEKVAQSLNELQDKLRKDVASASRGLS
jgi:hypothetical protein